MNKMLLIILALAAASLLGGCVVVEGHHPMRHGHVYIGPPPVVEVVPVPPPHWHRPHRW